MVRFTKSCKELQSTLKSWKKKLKSFQKFFQKVDKIQEIEGKNLVLKQYLFECQSFINEIQAHELFQVLIPLLVVPRLISEQYDRALAMLKKKMFVQEDPDHPGTYFYKNSYVPMWEDQSCPEYKVGKKYFMPTKQSILEAISPEQVRLFQELLDLGLEPHLQIVPLDALETIIEKIDEGAQEKICNLLDPDDEYVHTVYEPATFAATHDGGDLILDGGFNKSSMIEKYQGYLVSVVATKPNLDAPFDIDENLTHAQKAALLMTRYRSQGYSGMGYEDYLVANFLSGNTFDREDWSLLAESSIRSRVQPMVSRGHHNYSALYLQSKNAETVSRYCRFRPSIRIQLKKL